MPTLAFSHDSKEYEIPENGSIAEVCERVGIPFACTEGVCGTCVILVQQGMENLSEPSQEEHDFLGDDVDRERLACQCQIRRGKVKIKF